MIAVVLTRPIAKDRHQLLTSAMGIEGAIHGWGTPFGRLTENGFFWITSHAWYA